jgi:putative SOS response-associated peptidase YedK
MAGLWDVRRKPDGGKVESFTIITTVNARRIADKRIILS